MINDQIAKIRLAYRAKAEAKRDDVQSFVDHWKKLREMIVFNFKVVEKEFENDEDLFFYADFDGESVALSSGIINDVSILKYTPDFVACMVKVEVEVRGVPQSDWVKISDLSPGDVDCQVREFVGRALPG